MIAAALRYTMQATVAAWPMADAHARRRSPSSLVQTASTLPSALLAASSPARSPTSSTGAGSSSLTAVRACSAEPPRSASPRCPDVVGPASLLPAHLPRRPSASRSTSRRGGRASSTTSSPAPSSPRAVALGAVAFNLARAAGPALAGGVARRGRAGRRAAAARRCASPSMVARGPAPADPALPRAPRRARAGPIAGVLCAGLRYARHSAAAARAASSATSAFRHLRQRDLGAAARDLARGDQLRARRRRLRHCSSAGVPASRRHRRRAVAAAARRRQADAQCRLVASGDAALRRVDRC
ncbi:MAG: hypothetical protein MZW92_32430 [Comamonadaceae bacterium]|nr:hypothetical protein [Comamonadaceae bacterium]